MAVRCPACSAGSTRPQRSLLRLLLGAGEGMIRPVCGGDLGDDARRQPVPAGERGRKARACAAPAPRAARGGSDAPGRGRRGRRGGKRRRRPPKHRPIRRGRGAARASGGWRRGGGSGHGRRGHWRPAVGGGMAPKRLLQPGRHSARPLREQGRRRRAASARRRASLADRRRPRQGRRGHCRAGLAIGRNSGLAWRCRRAGATVGCRWVVGGLCGNTLRHGCVAGGWRGELSRFGVEASPHSRQLRAGSRCGGSGIRLSATDRRVIRADA